jgi:hypothetical protein
VHVSVGGGADGYEHSDGSGYEHSDGSGYEHSDEHPSCHPYGNTRFI